MKYFKLTITLIAIVASFLFFNKDVSNESVHKMVKSNFRIETFHCGCFGCGNEVITAFTKDNNRLLKITSLSQPTRFIEFTPEKERELESILWKLIDKTMPGYCTTHAELTFENNSFRFKVFDGSCSLMRFLE